jgi:hypothetical protein
MPSERELQQHYDRLLDSQHHIDLLRSLAPQQPAAPAAPATSLFAAPPSTLAPSVVVKRTWPLERKHISESHRGSYPSGYSYQLPKASPPPPSQRDAIADLFAAAADAALDEPQSLKREHEEEEEDEDRWRP